MSERCAVCFGGGSHDLAAHQITDLERENAALKAQLAQRDELLRRCVEATQSHAERWEDLGGSDSDIIEARTLFWDVQAALNEVRQ